jgi:hypothetical protein
LNVKAGGTFTINRAGDNSEAFSGTLSAKVDSSDAQDNVYVADFSNLRDSGEYYARYVDEDGTVVTSYTFRIGPGVYNSMFKLALKSYYFQRCGHHVHEDHTHGWNHTECHIGPDQDSNVSTFPVSLVRDQALMLLCLLLGIVDVKWKAGSQYAS